MPQYQLHAWVGVKRPGEESDVKIVDETFENINDENAGYQALHTILRSCRNSNREINVINLARLDEGQKICVEPNWIVVCLALNKYEAARRKSLRLERQLKRLRR